MTMNERGLTAAAILLAASLLLAPVSALAQDSTVRTVDPPSAVQGDTVLVKILGENLPTGAVVVDFFPQQIAVVDILSASSTEIIIQAKVPSLAPPGSYNIIIYNLDGNEAVASSMFSVTSEVLAPIFRGFDPKVIGQADTGFAILMSGDNISAEAVEHLSVQWQVNEKDIFGLTSTFTYSGTGNIVCAVAGKPPAGKLRGTIRLDNKPIYLIELEVYGSEGVVFGHTPAKPVLSDSTVELSLMGSGLTRDMVAGMTSSLSSSQFGTLDLKCRFVDRTTAKIDLPAQLTAGFYSIQVLAGQREIYSAEFELLPKPEKQPIQPPSQQLPPGQDNPLTQNATGEQAIASQQAQPGLPMDLAVEDKIQTLADGTSFAFRITTSDIDREALQRFSDSIMVDGEQARVIMRVVEDGGVRYVASTGLPVDGREQITLNLIDPENVYATRLLNVTGEDAQEVAVQQTEQPQPRDAEDAMLFNLTEQLSQETTVVSNPEQQNTSDETPTSFQIETQSTLPNNQDETSFAISQDASFSNRGFNLALRNAADGFTLREWSRVKLSTPNLLLASNIDKFMVEPEFTESEDAQGVLLKFLRNTNSFDDTAYEFFLLELGSSDGINLTLTWPEGIESVSGLVEFSSE